jgi:beta-aspartyl-peptidase (threonine type)
VLMIASANGAIGIDGVWADVEGGLDPVTAVERAAWFVEDNLDDHSVGTGGLPNLEGVVELDASIMDGDTRRAGCVAGLAGYRHPISVARAVMERSPHVLLVGEGAAKFAHEVGAEGADLLTDSARATWQHAVDQLDPSEAQDPLKRVMALTTDPEKAAGTVNFLYLNDDGSMASSVSTSGWAWKWPGRAGDSPVIGAGNYCDSRYGAAACTGFGELSLRASTARMVVRYLAEGMSPEEAGVTAIRELGEFVESSNNFIMHIVILAADGRHAAVSTKADATYAVREAGWDRAKSIPRTHVPAGQ